LCETAILREQKFSPAESRRAEDALIALSEMGIMPYETLAEERIARPYLLSELAGNSPAQQNFQYILLTHWPSTEASARWLASRSYRELESMGTLVSKHYQIVPERKPRMMLRPDRLQREWMARE
jgi:hypothetical protein